VIHRAHHLHDDHLFDCYQAERAGAPADLPSAEHLVECEACAVRYAELASFMEALRAEGLAEADAVFTPDVLRAQQQHVARRIELAGRHARVLSFPGRVVQRTMTASTSHAAPRWVAAAAAAGLFIGIAVGASYEYQSRPREANPRLLARDKVTSPSDTVRLKPAAPNAAILPEAGADDAFMSELELALERPRTRELVAFDALTPHVREVRDER
jgi:predicted anti-sigma-YlaC factor YlaD